MEEEDREEQGVVAGQTAGNTENAAVSCIINPKGRQGEESGAGLSANRTELCCAPLMLCYYSIPFVL